VAVCAMTLYQAVMSIDYLTPAVLGLSRAEPLLTQLSTCSQTRRIRSNAYT
jgi:hypothetical protein